MEIGLAITKIMYMKAGKAGNVPATDLSKHLLRAYHLLVGIIRQAVYTAHQTSVLRLRLIADIFKRML